MVEHIVCTCGLQNIGTWENKAIKFTTTYLMWIVGWLRVQFITYDIGLQLVNQKTITK